MIINSTNTRAPTELFTLSSLPDLERIRSQQTIGLVYRPVVRVPNPVYSQIAKSKGEGQVVAICYTLYSDSTEH